jgi:hypothetical protein
VEAEAALAVQANNDTRDLIVGSFNCISFGHGVASAGRAGVL